ncbi:MAG: alpha/beta hydrolase [Polyangiales bacterium]
MLRRLLLALGGAVLLVAVVPAVRWPPSPAPAARRVDAALRRCAWRPWPLDLHWHNYAGIEVLEAWSHGARPPERAPTLLILHGYGDDPEGPLPLVEDLPYRLRALLPQGPYRAPGGHAWFPALVRHSHAADYSHALAQATRRLGEWLIQMQARGHLDAPVILTGFSQGGIMALALALHYPQLVHAALPIAAWLPPRWRRPPPTRMHPLPHIYALHGTADQRIPARPAQQMWHTLRRMGWPVAARLYPGLGHQLGEAMAWQYKDWLVQALDARFASR